MQQDRLQKPRRRLYIYLALVYMHNRIEQHDHSHGSQCFDNGVERRTSRDSWECVDGITTDSKDSALKLCTGDAGYHLPKVL